MKNVTVKLVSGDGKEFPGVDVNIAKYSQTVKTMLEDLGVCEDNEDMIPLPNVTGEILKMVLEWAQFHQDTTGKECEKTKEWEKEFLNIEKYKLFELTRAANYLDVRSLLTACTSSVARLMEGKSAAQVRQLFDLN